MGEADFSRSRYLASADNAHAAGCVVHEPERSLPYERQVMRKKVGHGIYLCDFNGFFLSERRENAPECLREESFPRARCSTEKHVVSARCGNLQRSFRVVLPAYIGEINTLSEGGNVGACRWGGDRRRVFLSVENSDKFAEVLYSNHSESWHECGLRAVRRRDNDGGNAMLAAGNSR